MSERPKGSRPADEKLQQYLEELQQAIDEERREKFPPNGKIPEYGTAEYEEL